MSNKIYGFLICLLLILSTFGVFGNANMVSRYNQENIVDYNQSNKAKDIDWWPMFHHDISLTGLSTSSAPETNNLFWDHGLNEDIRFSSNVIFDDRLYIGTGQFWDTYKEDIQNYLDYGNNLPINIDYKTISNRINKKTIQSEGGAIYCLDANTGTEIWCFRTAGSIAASPVVSNNKVYFASADYYSLLGDIYCLDALNGEKIWNKTVYSYFTSPTVYDEKLYISTIEEGSGGVPVGTLLCLDTSTGLEEWKYTIGTNNLVLYSTPSLYDGKIYTTSLYNDQCQLHCVDSSNGNKLWIANLSIMDFGFALSSPVVDDEKVFVISAETENEDFWTELYCLDAISGEIIWSYTMKDNDNDEISFSTPAVDNGKIYYFSNSNSWSYGRIYCHDASSGDILWDIKTEECYTFSSPAISSDGKLFIGTINPINGKNKIFCCDTSDGSLIWSYNLQGTALMDSSPSIVKKRVYIASGSGIIYAFQDAFEIKEITGGIASVKAELANIWNDDLLNVDWSISVTGGIFGKINITNSERIEVLEAETSDIVRAFPIIGFGDIIITITVSTGDSCTCTKTIKGSVFGFITKI